MEVSGLDVFVTSTLPVGAGLSSSSAFICALLVTVNDLSGHRADPGDLAMTAQRAETEGVGVPIGVMDPMVSMLARMGHALLIDCQSLEYEHVRLEAATPGADTEILIVDTRTQRTLAVGEYAARRRACEEAASVLGVASLREVSISQLEDMSSDLDAVSLRRVRHVVTENARVLHAVDRLREGDITGLGKLLDDSHRSLAEDFEVSATALDLAVEVCRQAGAYGARLTGAGFGGCVIGLFPAGSMQAVEAALEKAFTARDMRSPRVFAGVSGPHAGRASA
jgi:galactokinase